MKIITVSLTAFLCCMIILSFPDLKGAETILLETLSINPSPAPTHYALGLVYEKRADYEKSVLQFKEGIKTFKSGKK